jgi:hypothetical protein
MTSLQAIETCDLAQPSIVVSTKMCSYANFRNVFIVMTAIPSVIIAIVVMYMVISSF